MTGYRVGTNGLHYYACQRHRRGDGKHRCVTGNIQVPIIDEFLFRVLSEVARLPEIVDAFVQMAKREQQKHEDTQRDLSTVLASLESVRARKERIKEEIKASPSKISRSEWRADLENCLVQEKSLQTELTQLTKRLQDDTGDADLRQQITSALGSAGEFVRSLSPEARDQFLKATIRKVVVNTPESENGQNGENSLSFEPVIEKGRYLVNIQFSESSLASMLSKHCAEVSINFGDWLRKTAPGSNHRPNRRGGFAGGAVSGKALNLRSISAPNTACSNGFSTPLTHRESPPNHCQGPTLGAAASRPRRRRSRRHCKGRRHFGRPGQPATGSGPHSANRS